MIKIIYFDMDGVLCDFDKRCNELSCWREDNHRPNWKKMEEIGPDFWGLMEPISVGMELYFKIKKFALDNKIDVGILSAIHLECGVIGKHNWIKSHIEVPSNLVKIVRNGKIKHRLASPENLLIDDNENNVNDFISSGGKAILFDRQKPLNELIDEIIAQFVYYGK